MRQIPRTKIALIKRRLQNFMEVILSDLGGAYSAVLVYIGDKLGFTRP